MLEVLHNPHPKDILVESELSPCLLMAHDSLRDPLTIQFAFGTLRLVLHWLNLAKGILVESHL